MATITPTIDEPGLGTTRVTWAGAATVDTLNSAITPAGRPLGGAIHIRGTFGSATVALQGSIDGTNWHALSDTQGTAISATAEAWFEFSTGAIYLRPSITGGTSDSIDVNLALRG